MKKSAGPDLKIEIPPMKKCEHCDGTGMIEGTFYQMECDTCNATGVLHKETGEQIPTSTVLIAMRQLIKRQRQQIEHLKKNQMPHDPYGHLNDRRGGKHRMD
ncbi:MAG: hypothetical protein OIF55_16745 [Amphritea sp.]|nr:hypothetical protein [Amphritea sp.]